MDSLFIIVRHIWIIVVLDRGLSLWLFSTKEKTCLMYKFHRNTVDRTVGYAIYALPLKIFSMTKELKFNDKGFKVLRFFCLHIWVWTFPVICLLLSYFIAVLIAKCGKANRVQFHNTISVSNFFTLDSMLENNYQ